MKNQRKHTGPSGLAWLLLVLFSWSVFQPAISYAGGPTQPEASSFTPIGVSDMVDPFTGDFTYNIPLMDIEGYPINIAYNSGVTIDQEASWVGLGWNLNAGSITRALRGLPDDFKGDEVIKTNNIKPSFNMEVDAGFSGEIFGFDFTKIVGNDTSLTGNLNVNLNMSAGLTFNNYTGFGSSISIGPSFGLSKYMGGKATAGFSLSGSSENGASFAPSISLTHNEKRHEIQDYRRTGTIGTAFNSRAGLQSLSYGFSQGLVEYDWDRNLKRTFSELTSKQAGIGGSFNLGVAQYFPTPSHPKVGGSLAFQLNASTTVFGLDGQGNIGISVSSQWIPENKKALSVPSYGYMYHDQGVRSKENQLDFNRDNDQPFSKYSVNLPSAFQTYDIFSVQAQGTSGSFRPQRNEVSYVYDKTSGVFDIGGSVGLELGIGGTSDVGVDIQVPITTTYSGMWTQSNNAQYSLMAKGDRKQVPSFAFIEANESSVQSDDLMTTQFYGLNPEKLVLAGSALLPRVDGKLDQSGAIVPLNRNAKNTRELTNNQLYTLTRAEVQQGLGVLPLSSDIYGGAKSYHISEITQLGQDGRRYVFALPVYNYLQEDVTFATGDGLYSTDGIDYQQNNSGLIGYSGTDATVKNKRGIDHYYNSVQTPAYAHSYMLSAVLSDDYIDSDGHPGPSPNDLGSYVKFDYTKISDHKWRSPMSAKQAFYNEGMRSDKKDDKASFTYGEQDLFYLKQIETKNYIAIFEVVPRSDGYSVLNRDGEFNTGTASNSQCLKSITLYSKADIAAQNGNISAATPLQKVEFVYDYSLCPNYPANLDPSTLGGKLTLLEIKFTYQNSKKMENRGYKFNYSSENPLYNLKGSDRWGTYKPNASGSETNIQTALNNAEYPYTEQNKTLADQYASAWALTSIKLPSGGEINVSYESDDYQFVQHKKASQMFKIIGVAFENGTNSGGQPVYDTRIHTSRTGLDYVDLTDNSLGTNPYLLFELENQNDDLSKYAKVDQQLYFRALMKLNPSGLNFKEQTEFVSGYGIIESITTVKVGSVNYGAIKLKGEKLMDLGSSNYSPLIKQAILLGRTQLSRTITQNNFPQNSSDPSGIQAIKDLSNSMLDAISSFKEIVTGPNKFIYDQNKGRSFVPLSSWMRLSCPSGRKLGGGSRVKQITINDNWNAMSGGASATYGQLFHYELEDGTSSGVASYEPQLGGDENTWHSAYIINQKKRFALDDKMYIEDPIMESQFPSPAVGYSRVVIEDLHSGDVGAHGTGKVVKEFYTARDFPTIVKSTTVDILPKNSILPLLPKYQYLTANQGFSIELNDMHGKPKKESVYGQDQTTPLSTVEYFYKSEDLGLGGVSNKRLKNEVTVIRQNGESETEIIGIRYDAVADFRESKTVSQVPAINVNTNSFIIGLLPIVMPTVYPGYDRTTNRFRSATMNKTIQRFGILDKTVANQDGSIVETNNLAYDAQTGQVLITQTTTDFNDKVYSLNYPAYWKYPSFGQASKNILYTFRAATINTNGYTAIPASLNYFTEGDEVSVTTTSGVTKAWVVEKNVNGIRLEDKRGNPVSGTDAIIKVIRSGYRNKQQTSMASMTTLDNPLDNLPTNQFSQVLNAGAVEFAEDWKTYCECFNPIDGTSSNNPYVLGIKGNWRPIKSYTYLSGRTQTNYDGNTNIRKDGVFTSYAPFYKLGNGQWIKDGLNWTFVSEVTQFSPNGMTLETKDALGRYSSSLFSFNNTLTTAVAANAKMTQVAVGSFEDLNALSCSDQGYFSRAYINNAQVSIPSGNRAFGTAHTGRTSLAVTPSTPLTFQNILSNCVSQDNCSLSLSLSGDNHVIVSGGEPIYTLEYEAQGVATAEFIDSDMIEVMMDTRVETGKLIIYVTDSNGCKIGGILTVSGGQIQLQTIQE